MANSVVRLSIDSHEFDANIKRAGEALNKFFDQARKGDRTFEMLDDDAMEVIRVFGQMETKSKSASGQLAELTKGFTDLSVIYKRFTDEEKASGTGKIVAQQLDELKARITETKAALDFSTQSLNGPQAIKSELRELTQEIANTTIAYRSLSDEERNGATGREMQAKIQQMTERAGTLRDAMDDANRSIKGFSSDTKVFDRISQGVAFLTSSFQTAIGAAKLFGFNIGDNVEVIAKLQAAMAVTNGLTQVQTALQKESALMQGVMAVQAKAAAAAIALEGSNTKAATVAQAAFNAVAKANPYVLLASAVAAVGAALIGFSGNAKKATESIKVETEAMRQAQRMSDIWKNSLSGTFSSLMTKYDELKRQWSELKNEHQKIDWIKNNQTALQNLGGAINDVKSAENFFNDNTDAVVQSFVRRAQAAARVAQLTELYRKQIELLDKKERTQQAITEDAARSGRRAQAGEEIKDSSYWNSRYGSVDREGKWRFSEQGAKLYSGIDTSTADSVVKVDVELQANQSEIDKIKGQITNEFNDVVITPQGQNTNPTESSTPKTEMQQNEAAIAKLTEEYQNLATAAKTADDAQKAGMTERMIAIQGEIKTLQDRNAELKKFSDEAKGVKVAVDVPNSLPQLTHQLKDLQQAQSQSLDTREWVEYQKQIDVTTTKIDILKGKWKDGQVATFKVDVEAYDKLKELQDLTIEDGTITVKADTAEAYNKVQELISDIEGTTVSFDVKPQAKAIPTLDDYRIQAMIELDAQNTKVDTSTLQTLLQDSIQQGIDITSLNLEPLAEQIGKGINVPDEKWQEILNKYNELRAQIGEEPIQIDFKSGKISEDGKSAEKSWKSAASAIQSVGSAFSQIEDPAAKVAGIVAQAIATVASAYAQALATDWSTKSNIWAFIAAAAASTASMVTTIATIHSATGFAEGGIVPGNNFSGDNLHTVDYGINSGELILNRSQQSTIASALMDAENARGGYAGTPYVTGEKIVMGVNNWGRSTGRGQLVFSKS